MYVGWLPTHGDDHADLIANGTSRSHTAAATCTCGSSSGVRPTMTDTLGWVDQHAANPRK